MTIPLLSSSRRLSPTDVTTFIRLEQCERYLRLRLHERVFGLDWMKEFGVVPQPITPLLRFSGARFEDELEDDFARHSTVLDCAHQGAASHKTSRARDDDNARVLDAAQNLENGASLLVLQPRLETAVAGWVLRGDVDILRLSRAADGVLHALIVDAKSTTTPKIEHRLQVAFYHEMLRALLQNHAIAVGEIELGVLFRGEEDVSALDAATQKLRDEQRIAAQTELGTGGAFLEIVSDKDAYLESVRDLVTGSDSRAQTIGQKPFETVPFHLERKCDACSYQEFCLKWSVQHDDLSLVPHLSSHDKTALQRCGISTVNELAHLKEFRHPPSETTSTRSECEEDAPSDTAADLPFYISGLVAGKGREELVERVARTWPIGARIDELVHRARRCRKSRGDKIRTWKNIPSKGYGSLPFCASDHNPNLIRIYIDAQHDYLHDRIYLLGALVTASENGAVVRRRHIVHLSEKPLGNVGEKGDAQSDAREADLFLRWSRELLQAVYELAAPDENNEKRAPLHIVFWDGTEQTLLLEGLGRHATTIFAATPIYDFVTQIAAFDSPIVSFLEAEIRELKNYPVLAQTLQGISEHLKFSWKQDDEDLRTLFYERHFDVWGKLDASEIPDGDKRAWYARRARFRSSIPLEYSYAAWNALPPPIKGRDDFAPFRNVTLNHIRAFQQRRLDALEHIANDFKGNQLTLKTPFHLPDLTTFDGKAQNAAQALHEFVTIERHVGLAAWKKARLAPPERRMIAGDTLVVSYQESDQHPETVARNRENVTRKARHEAWKEANPGGRRSKADMAETDWKMDAMRFRLRLDCAAADCDLEHALAASTLRAKSGVVVSRRVEQDSRLPENQRTDFTPTPKQLLYGMRAQIVEIETQRDRNGVLHNAFALVEIVPSRSAGRGEKAPRGFVFGGYQEPFFDGVLYTLDENPDDWMGNHCAGLTRELCDGAQSVLLNRLNHASSTRTSSTRTTSTQSLSARMDWPPKAAKAQARFLEGLDALDGAGAFHELESGKRDFIGAFGDAPILLVQGPPGTGKSYSTAFALFARMQDAMAMKREFRIGVTCKTHAATDVLMQNIRDVQNKMRGWKHEYSKLFETYFDARLLDAPIFRLSKTETLDGVVPVPKKSDLGKGQKPAFKAVSEPSWCFVATTPAGTRSLLKDAQKDLFTTPLLHCIVLDEASQMDLPQAILSTLTLHEDGQLIVVGDHRQMPPIVRHDWKFEPRRTFATFKSYASLFETLLELPAPPPKINFEESFRLHQVMAEFLRREVYQHDGINYHSHQTDVLKNCSHNDDFVRAVLSPDFPLVVVVHSESGSLLSNRFERDLIAPLLEALSGADFHDLDGESGLGVVVPHRAQKAALQDARWNVDTVERFQGDERTAILVGATESDRDYLLQNGRFLLDPRRLTVALSRAKQKMILVAAQSVFEVFSPDEETFANAQLWKNLLRYTCTEKLWEGERNGESVQVWGNGKL